MRWVLVFGVLAVAGTANADGSVTARLGLGLGGDELNSGPVGLALPTVMPGGVVELELGYKVTPELAVTVRTSVAIHEDHELGTVRTIGLGVSYAMTQLLWVAPWLGAATIGVSDNYSPNPMLGGGIDTGCDLATWGDHHLGAFVGVSHGGNFSITTRESAGVYQVAFGVAYRYW